MDESASPPEAAWMSVSGMKALVEVTLLGPVKMGFKGPDSA